VNVLDWIIVILLIGGAIGGLRRGLIRSLVGLGGVALGLVLASQFYRPLCGYLETHFSLVSRLAASLGPHLPLAATVASAPAGQGAAFIDAIRGLSLPAVITNYLAASAQNMAGLPAGVTVGQALATLLASAMLGVLCFVAVFVVVQVVAVIVARLIAGAVAITPLHLVDHVTGGLLGAAWTAVFLTLIIGGLGLLASVPVFAFAQPALEGSRFAPVFIAWFQRLVPTTPQWLGSL